MADQVPAVWEWDPTTKDWAPHSGATDRILAQQNPNTGAWSYKHPETPGPQGVLGHIAAAVPGHAFERGILSTQEALALGQKGLGGDPNEAARDISTLERRRAAITPQGQEGEDIAKLGTQDSLLGEIGFFMTHPSAVLSTLSQGLGEMLPSLGVGSAVGATTGAVLAATGVGATVAAPVAAVVSDLMGGASFGAQTYGTSILGSLAQRGVNIQDATSLAAALKDPAMMEAAKNDAVNQGLAAGATFAAMNFLGGKVAPLAARALPKDIGGFTRGAVGLGGEAATQAGVGAAGSVAGQMASGDGDVNNHDVWTQALGAAAMSPLMLLHGRSKPPEEKLPPGQESQGRTTFPDRDSAIKWLADNGHLHNDMDAAPDLLVIQHAERLANKEELGGLLAPPSAPTTREVPGLGNLTDAQIDQHLATNNHIPGMSDILGATEVDPNARRQAGLDLLQRQQGNTEATAVNMEHPGGTPVPGEGEPWTFTAGNPYAPPGLGVPPKGLHQVARAAVDQIAAGTPVTPTPDLIKAARASGIKGITKATSGSELADMILKQHDQHLKDQAAHLQAREWERTAGQYRPSPLENAPVMAVSPGGQDFTAATQPLKVGFRVGEAAPAATTMEEHLDRIAKSREEIGNMKPGDTVDNTQYSPAILKKMEGEGLLQEIPGMGVSVKGKPTGELTSYIRLPDKAPKTREPEVFNTVEEERAANARDRAALEKTFALNHEAKAIVNEVAAAPAEAGKPATQAEKAVAKTHGVVLPDFPTKGAVAAGLDKVEGNAKLRKAHEKVAKGHVEIKPVTREEVNKGKQALAKTPEKTPALSTGEKNILAKLKERGSWVDVTGTWVHGAKPVMRTVLAGLARRGLVERGFDAKGNDVWRPKGESPAPKKINVPAGRTLPAAVEAKKIAEAVAAGKVTKVEAPTKEARTTLSPEAKVLLKAIDERGVPGSLQMSDRLRQIADDHGIKSNDPHDILAALQNMRPKEAPTPEAPAGLKAKLEGTPPKLAPRLTPDEMGTLELLKRVKLWHEGSKDSWGEPKHTLMALSSLEKKGLVTRYEAAGKSVWKITPPPEKSVGWAREGKLTVYSGMPPKMERFTKNLLKMVGLGNHNLTLVPMSELIKDPVGLARRMSGDARTEALLQEMALKYADKNTNGLYRNLDGSNHVIAIKDSLLDKGPAVFIPTLAHEIGHMVMRVHYDHAPESIKAALAEQHAKDTAGIGKPAGFVKDDLAKFYNPLHYGENTHQLPQGTRWMELENSAEHAKYFRSFNEWFAENVSKWATTDEKPRSLVERFFSEIANHIRKLAQAVFGTEQGPAEAVTRFMRNLQDQHPVDVTTGPGHSMAAESASRGVARVADPVREQANKFAVEAKDGAEIAPELSKNMAQAAEDFKRQAEIDAEYPPFTDVPERAISVNELLKRIPGGDPRTQPGDVVNDISRTMYHILSVDHIIGNFKSKPGIKEIGAAIFGQQDMSAKIRRESLDATVATRQLNKVHNKIVTDGLEAADALGKAAVLRDNVDGSLTVVGKKADLKMPLRSGEHDVNITIPKEAVAGFKAARAMFDKMFEEKNRSLLAKFGLDATTDVKGLDAHIKDLEKQLEKAGRGSDEAKGLREDITKVKGLQMYLDTAGGFRDNYLPRIRLSGWGALALKMTDPTGRDWVGNFSNPLPFRSRQMANSFREEKLAQGWTNKGIVKADSTHLIREIRAKGDSFDTIEQLSRLLLDGNDSIIKDENGKPKKDFRGRPVTEADEIIKHLGELRQLFLANKIAGGRFAKSRDVPGYLHKYNEANYLQGAISSYGASGAQYIAANTFARAKADGMAALAADPTSRRLYQYFLEHEVEMRTPGAGASMLRALGFHSTLGFNLASAFVNTFQIIQATLPYLSRFGPTASATKHISTGMKDAMRLVDFRRGYQGGADELFNLGPKMDKILSPEEAALLRRARYSGDADPILTGELSGHQGSLGSASPWERALGHGLAKVGVWSTFAFSATEQATRIGALLAAHRFFTEHPEAATKAMEYMNTRTAWNPKNLEDLALYSSRETMGYFNKANRPRFLHGMEGVALQFSQYPLMMMQLMFRMAGQGKGAMKNEGGFKALGLMTLGVWFTAGLMGLPGVGHISGLFQAGSNILAPAFGMSPVDVDVELRKGLASVLREIDMPDDAAALNVILKGGFRQMTGMSTEGRTALNWPPESMMSGDALDILGPFGSVLSGGVESAYRYNAQGQTGLAIASLFPSLAFRNVAKATYAHPGPAAGVLGIPETGIGLPSGERGASIIKPSGPAGEGQGPMSEYEHMMSSLGMTPARVADLREANYNEKQINERMKEVRNNFSTKLANYQVQSILFRNSGDVEGAKDMQRKYQVALQEAMAHDKQQQDARYRYILNPGELQRSVQEKTKVYLTGPAGMPALQKIPALERPAVVQERKKLFGIDIGS